MASVKTVYIVGALKNPQIPVIARKLREWGYDAFDEWWCCSEDADEWWQQYSKDNGLTYKQALDSWHAKNVCDFDVFHMDRSHGALLVMPAGKSGHLELGRFDGQGKPAFVLFDKEPDRYDIMYRLARGGVHFDLDSLKAALDHYLPVD